MLELLAFPFFQRALIVGAILGSLMALLGVLVVLRKMSFFSDAIGHSALTGIAIALLLHIDPFLGALVFALLVATFITLIRFVSNLSIDTLLGVFFPAAVALGVILVALTPGYQGDLISFLFGNILTVGKADIYTTIVVGILVVGVMTWAGKGFVSIAFDAALARAEGIPVRQFELLFFLVLAAVIALAIKFVGVILVTALLVIPAASAQNMSRSLASMFGLSVAFSLVAVVIGMLSSAALATPSGPTIVLASAGMFILSLVGKRLLER